MLVAAWPHGHGLTTKESYDGALLRPEQRSGGLGHGGEQFVERCRRCDATARIENLLVAIGHVEHGGRLRAGWNLRLHVLAHLPSALEVVAGLRPPHGETDPAPSLQRLGAFCPGALFLCYGECAIEEPACSPRTARHRRDQPSLAQCEPLERPGAPGDAALAVPMPKRPRQSTGTPTPAR